jgi:hypothetical protein
VLAVAEFREAVDSFCIAVRQHDEDAQQRNLDQLLDEFGRASQDDVRDAASLLADVLHGVPAGRDAHVAVLIGACVERGGDAADCAEPVLFRAQLALEGAAEFCRRWRAAEGADYPEPTGEPPPDELYAPLGGTEDRSARTAVLGWWNVPMWQSAVVAVLGRKDVRKALLPRPEFYETTLEVVQASGAGSYLVEVLGVLDDEPLIALHRPTRQGFVFTMSGIADNFQLHTLLADKLVTPGHLPGVAPSAEAVEACLAQSPEAPYEYEATGSFNLVAPDGTWIWNEGSPIDIPVVDDARLLVLDPPPYERSWSGVRAFAGMSAELTLERRLSDDGVARLMTRVSPSIDPNPPAPAEPEEPTKRHWWKR